MDKTSDSILFNSLLDLSYCKNHEIEYLTNDHQQKVNNKRSGQCNPK